MKKIFSLLLVGIVILTLTGCGKNKKTEITKIEEPALILYFSATSNTKNVAFLMHDVKGYEMLQIIPEETYTKKDLDYNNEKSRAYIEQHEASSRPTIKNKMDLSKYKTIFLGYPIWFGKEPKIIISLLDNYDLEGKTIIPFATSEASDITVSVENIRNYNPNLKVLDGKRFSSEVTEEELKEWFNTFEYKK